jgi:zinc protease
VNVPTLARGLSPARQGLDNGVVAIAQQNTATPAIAINATFAAGSFRDPEQLPGLANLASMAIDRGTRSRSGNVIAEELDDRGVSLRITVTRHTFSVACVCLTEDFRDILALVSDIVREPSFPESEVAKRRGEALTGVLQDADSTAVRSVEGMLELLYGADHPYARPARGTPQSLEAITAEHLAAFHRRFLVPSALRVVIAGDIDPHRAIDEVAREFSAWSGVSAEPEIVPPPVPPARRTRVIPMPGKLQSDVSYGFTAVRRLDPRYYAYSLLNHVLGQFGLGGRLADNIRERQGMAYYAFSSFDGTVGEGPVVVRAGVDPKNVHRTLEAIDAEVTALRNEGPRPAELEESRAALIGSIPRMFETNDSIADFLQTVEHFGLGLDHDRKLPALLSAVTMDDVRQAADELLDVNHAAIAVAGPHEAEFPL